MPYRTPEHLAEEFAKDWNAALCPSFDEYMTRVHPERQDELAHLITDFLEEAPTPPYSPVQMRRLQEQVKTRFGDKMKPVIEKSMEKSKAEFDALPWHVRKFRRLRWRVWQQPIWWLRIHKQKLGKQPWE